MQDGPAGFAEGEEDIPADPVIFFVFRFQPNIAATLFRSINLQVIHTGNGCENAANLLLGCFSNQIYSSGSRKEPFQILWTVAGYQLALGNDQNGLAHCLDF